MNTEMTLDAFFPFDPLPLKSTGTYIDGLFKQWETCEIVNEDEVCEVECDVECDVEY